MTIFTHHSKVNISYFIYNSDLFAYFQACGRHVSLGMSTLQTTLAKLTMAAGGFSIKSIPTSETGSCRVSILTSTIYYYTRLNPVNPTVVKPTI